MSETEETTVKEMPEQQGLFTQAWKMVSDMYTDDPLQFEEGGAFDPAQAPHQQVEMAELICRMREDGLESLSSDEKRDMSIAVLVFMVQQSMEEISTLQTKLSLMESVLHVKQ